MLKITFKLINQTTVKAIGILFLTAFISIHAHAAEISGVMFDEFYQDQEVSMTLQGTGLKTMIFFKAFAAGFYKDHLNGEDLLGEIPKRIEVEYFVNIPGKKLNNFTIDIMKDNITQDEFNQIQTEVALMSQYFVDLKAGDRFSLTYIPGVGTKFAHNGQITGIIEGKDFAKALFSVWIGEKPFDRNLKNKILGFENDQDSQKQKLVMRVEG